MHNSGETQRSNGDSVELRQSDGTKRSVERSDSVKCSSGADRNSFGNGARSVNTEILRNQLSMSLAPLLKTKGRLHHKKRGAFSKWKEYFTFLDVPSFQLHFYKEESDHESLNTCVISVDLRFVDRIVPRKGGILSRKSCFKVYRKAGLSTVQLATHSDEERAEWITTVESLLRRIKYSPEAKSGPSMKSATLPKRHTLNFSGHQSDSDKSLPSSISEECEIQPRKISKTSFHIMSSEISGIKLRKHSPEPVNNCLLNVHSVAEKDENTSSAFGIQLKKVDQEEKKTQQFLDQKDNETEFQQKFNSLSKTKRSPKLPLSENVKHSVGDKAAAEIFSNSSPRSSPAKTQDRKISHVSVIPLSKSVQSVVQNNPNLEETIKEKIDKVNLGEMDVKSETKICHAVTTEIPTFDCELKELSGNKSESFPEKLVAEPSKVDATFVLKERYSSMQELAEENLPELHTPDKTNGSGNSTPVKLISSIEVTLMKSVSPKKPPRSFSFENKTARKKVTKILSYSGTTELQHKMQTQQIVIKENISKEDYSLKRTSLENIKNDLSQIGNENAKSALTARDSVVADSQQNDLSEKSTATSEIKNCSNFTHEKRNFPSDIENDTFSKISNDIVISAITNAFDECLYNVSDVTDAIEPDTLIIDETSYVINEVSDHAILSNEISKKIENEKYKYISNRDDNLNSPADIEIIINRDTIREADKQADESDVIENQADSDSPVKIRRSYLRESIIDEETLVKRPSALSILSSESDDPLPKFNFMGKSERSSCNSYSFREPLYIDEKVAEEVIADSRQSSTSNNEKITRRTADLADNVIDFSKTLLGDENDVLLNDPIFISICDVDAISGVGTTDHIKSHQEVEINEDIVTDTATTRNNREKTNSVNKSIIDEVDYFPTQEETDERLNKLFVEKPSPLRTSGIVELNEYLAKTSVIYDEELYSGVNRLGSSVAVEKLKEEVKEK